MFEQVVAHIVNMTVLELCGWIGALCLACCALPQAIMSIRQKHSNGVSNGLLWLWGLGEFFTLFYLLNQDTLNWPLLVNYLSNIVFVGIVAWYKVFPYDSRRSS